MKCFSLLLGARRIRTGGRRFSRRDEARLHGITFRHFPEGFTVMNADGGWFDPTRGKFIREESRQVLVCTNDRRRLRAWCRELGRAFVQQELLLVEVGRATRVRMPAS
jgi:hypothetical protein